MTETKNTYTPSLMGRGTVKVTYSILRKFCKIIVRTYDYFNQDNTIQVLCKLEETLLIKNTQQLPGSLSELTLNYAQYMVQWRVSSNRVGSDKQSMSSNDCSYDNYSLCTHYIQQREVQFEISELVSISSISTQIPTDLL